MPTYRIILSQDYSSFTVSCQHPQNSAIFQLFRTDLPRESPVWLIKDVLCGDFNFFAKVLTSEKEKDARGSNDNL